MNAIYARQSVDRADSISIESQIEFCQYEMRGEQYKVYTDRGYSGKNTDRPAFAEMMNDIENGVIGKVVVYKLDRISRSILDFSNMMEKFGKHRVEFVSTTEKFDTSSPMGRAMLNICIVFAQLERETTAERIRDNMHELAKSGRWLGGTTPTGYKSTQIVGSVTVDGKERKAYKLDIIKEEAEIIKLIFSKFLETNSLTKTDTYLLQNNVTTKNGKNFTRFSIRSILQNPVYMIADQNAWAYFDSLGVEIYAEQSEFDGKHGIMAYNKTIQKSGKSNQMRDMDEWIVAVGKHKGLIAGADWVKVQELLNQNRSKSYRKPKSNVALLSGLLYCGNCGSFMRPKLSQRTNAQGEKIYSYLCETKERSRCKLCNSKNPNGNELDKMVCEQIKLISEDSSDFIRNLESVQRKLEGNREEYDQQLNALKKELQENEQQIANLVDTLAKTPNTPAFDYITQQINTLHEKNEKIKNRINELESLTKNHLYSSEEFDRTKELLKSFGQSFDTMGVEQKRMALRAFIRRIIWDGENVHVVLFGDTESEIDYTDLAEEKTEPKRGDSE